MPGAIAEGSEAPLFVCRREKNRPGRKVVAEIFKAVGFTGWYKHHIARIERVSFITILEITGAGYDEIDFISPVRFLRVIVVRFIDFDFQRTTFEQAQPGIFRLVLQLLQRPLRIYVVFPWKSPTHYISLCYAKPHPRQGWRAA